MIKLNLIESQHSICRYVWPIAAIMGVSYSALAYFFTNEEMKEIYGIRPFMILGIPLMFVVLYCKYRDYFSSAPETKLVSGAVIIHEKGIKIKSREYTFESIIRVNIKRIEKDKMEISGIKNEILINSKFGVKKFNFRLESINESQLLIELLTELLADEGKLNVDEKIKKLMQTIPKKTYPSGYVS